MKLRLAALALSLGVAACGPQGRDQYGGDDHTSSVDAPPAFGPEVCDDGFDNDQDGAVDCSDQDCSGVGNCPVCEPPTTQALALPDGIDLDGGTCSTAATCGSGYSCVAGYCADPYVSQAIWSTFGPGAALADPNQLQKVCLNIEHSYFADLQIELIAPNGAHLILHAYNRSNSPNTYLGDANDDDDDYAAGVMPVPGVGNEYCFTPTATTLLWQGAQVPSALDGHKKIAPGDYKAASPWTVLTGAPLDGTWELQVTDLWRIDNGFLFSWSMELDPALAPGCGPVIIY